MERFTCARLYLYIQTPQAPVPTLEYSLKIVNPEKMSIYTNVRVGVWKQYVTGFEKTLRVGWVVLKLGTEK